MGTRKYTQEELQYWAVWGIEPQKKSQSEYYFLFGFLGTFTFSVLVVLGLLYGLDSLLK